MSMSPGDIFYHELILKLEQPSFIKHFPPQLSDNSAYWLTEQLSELCSEYTEDDLNSILNIFKTHWSVFAIDEDWVEEYYSSSFERLSLLIDFQETFWKCESHSEIKTEVDIHEVAMVVAIDALGQYLMILLGNDERNQSGLLTFELDQVHQAHFLAQELKYKFELNKAKLELNIRADAAFKAALKHRASKGGKAKALKQARLKRHIIELYKENLSCYQSSRHASQLLVAEASNYCKNNNISPLMPSNAQRTIYEWIREYVKDRN